MSQEEMHRLHRAKMGPISIDDLTATDTGQVTADPLAAGWHIVEATGADAHVLQCTEDGATAITSDPTIVLAKGKHVPKDTEYHFFVADDQSDGYFAYVRSASDDATLRVSRGDDVYRGE